jgi:hypothetical protein
MKTKLTESITEEITKRLKVGCYAKMAAAAFGVPERTYYTWLERGEKAEKMAELGKKISKKETIYCQLCQSVWQSEAEGETTLTTAIFSNVTFDMESEGVNWQIILDRIGKPGISH